MEKADYIKLYNVQDQVLKDFFTVEHSFYLTGGTALNRFYKEIRFSEDLDFFSNDAVNLSEIIRFAREKMFFGYEDLVYRLYTFPLDWVDGIDFTDLNTKALFFQEYQQMCEGFENVIEKMET